MTFAPQRVRLCFLPTGPEPAARLELVEPMDDDSGVARFLAAHGEGVHHVCFLTDDLPGLARGAGGRGGRAHRPRTATRRAWPVAFVHPRTLSGVLWELLEADSE